MVDIAIREATADDAAAIHAMVVALAEHIGKKASVSSTPELIRDGGFGASPAFKALIARRDGAPIGLALYFFEFSTWRGRRGVYLQDLYVAPSARGFGLGRRLVHEVAARGVKAEAIYMRLSVDAANDAAARFYEELGFAERDDERLFMLDGAAFAAMGGK